MPQNKGSLVAQLRSFIKRKTSQQYRFDLQFTNKKWDGLRSLAELGRYSIIVGYVRYFTRDAAILDLGCGEGILQQKFAPSDYAQYVGVDFSKVAIDSAQALANGKTKFVTGDLNHLNIEGSFDVIIYNESINYLSDPPGAVKALFPHLKEGGIVIISLVDKHGNEQTWLWEKLGTVLDLVERTKVTNLEGNSWTVQVYRRR